MNVPPSRSDCAAQNQRAAEVQQPRYHRHARKLRERRGQIPGVVDAPRGAGILVVLLLKLALDVLLRIERLDDADAAQRFVNHRQHRAQRALARLACRRSRLASVAMMPPETGSSTSVNSVSWHRHVKQHHEIAHDGERLADHGRAGCSPPTFPLPARRW